MYQNGLKNNQTTPSAREGEQWLDPYTAGGTPNGAATLEESWKFPIKLKTGFHVTQPSRS